jgi:predicted flap endonuclease-1-like 5' DNA nuclease
MNHTPDYTFGIASLEIIILLLVAFLLGMLLCRLLGAGSSSRAGHAGGHAATPGGFTANMDSLLRDSSASAASGLAAGAGAMGGILNNLRHLGDGRKDDLKKLEGIGPKIEEILNAAGIQNFDQLAAVSTEHLRPILDAAGGQFKMHDPKSWPYQAELAVKGEWERLKEYQDLLISGKE